MLTNEPIDFISTTFLSRASYLFLPPLPFTSEVCHQNWRSLPQSPPGNQKAIPREVGGGPLQRVHSITWCNSQTATFRFFSASPRGDPGDIFVGSTRRSGAHPQQTHLVIWRSSPKGYLKIIPKESGPKPHDSLLSYIPVRHVALEKIQKQPREQNIKFQTARALGDRNCEAQKPKTCPYWSKVYDGKPITGGACIWRKKTVKGFSLRTLGLRKVGSLPETVD